MRLPNSPSVLVSCMLVWVIQLAGAESLEGSVDAGLDAIANSHQASRLSVEVDDLRRITINADSVSLLEILEGLAELGVLHFESAVPLEERLTLRFSAYTLEQALDAILRDHSYILASPAPADHGLENILLTVLTPAVGDDGSLASSLIDADQRVRIKAVADLALLDSEVRGPLLELAYADASSAVRVEVVETAADTGDASVIGLLERALQDPTFEVKEEAIEALGEIGDERSVWALAPMLQDEDPDLREETVLALGRIGGADAVDLLLTALYDSDEDVRDTAREMLDDLSGPDQD